MIESLYGCTYSPTIVESNSRAVNVYPTKVTITVDCRTLAGCDGHEVETEVWAALNGVEARWEVEWINVVRGNSSTYPSPLSEAIGVALQRHVPNADLGRTHRVDFTDSHWLRAAFPEVIAYNFAPHVTESHANVSARAHGVDEHILLSDLAFEEQFWRAPISACRRHRPSPPSTPHYATRSHESRTTCANTPMPGESCPRRERNETPTTDTAHIVVPASSQGRIRWQKSSTN